MRYYFAATLAGSGRNKQEAWESAIAGLQEDPGDAPDPTSAEAADDDEQPHYCVRHAETEDEWFIPALAIAKDGIIKAFKQFSDFIPGDPDYPDHSDLAWREDEFYTADGDEWDFDDAAAKLRFMQELEDLNNQNDSIA